MDDLKIVETDQAAPDAGNAASSYDKVSQDDFIANLKRQTEGDYRNKETPPNAGQDQPKPPGPNPDAEIELVSKLLVNVVDVGMQITCTAISGEADPELFKISNTQKEQIREPLTELMKFYKIQLNPWWILGIALIVAYSSPVMKAVSISQKKKAAKKQGHEAPVIEIKRGPGRPRKEETN